MRVESALGWRMGGNGGMMRDAAYAYRRDNFGQGRSAIVHHHEHHHHAAETAPTEEERSVALLAYMVDHNRSHAEELEQLAGAMNPDVAAMVRDAISQFNAANDKLAEALSVLRGE